MISRREFMAITGTGLAAMLMAPISLNAKNKKGG